MNVQKEARRDAAEYARAQMFYGDGAGIRRKLIVATVEGKAQRNPAYGAAFSTALSHQDMAEHAEKARKERDRIDKKEAVSKNLRGIASGNYQSVNASVLVIAAAAYVAHRTGYDRRMYEAGKKKYEEIKTKLRAKKRPYIVS